MELGDVIAVATFVAIGSGSPGPNNALLLASGMSFGFRRTVPHVVGTAVGIMALVGLAAVGAGAIVTAIPGVRLALRITASIYMLVLAVRLARGFSVDGSTAAEPFTVVRAASFQSINPKAWFFALALVGAASVEPRASAIGEGLTLLGIVAVVVTATAAGWALGGSVLRPVLEGDRARRVVGVVLGVTLAGSVVLLWLE